MQFKPIRDRVVIQVLDAETTTKSGIVIPDAATEKPNQGKVLAVGEGRITEEGVVIPMEVKTGDLVMFAKNAGQPVKIEGQEYHILREDDIIAIVQ